MPEISAGLHCNNIILGIQCFRLPQFELPQWLNGQQFRVHYGGPESFPEKVYKSLFFNSDIKNFLKNQWGRDREPDFVIFLVQSPLIVGGWRVVAQSRDSCLGLAEIASFVFLVYSRMGDPALVQDLIFLFLMLIKEMRRRCEFKIFLRDLRDGKILFRSSASCYKIENVLWE